MQVDDRRKVTWSRYNSVAYITGDGRGVIIRHLLRSSEDGKWTLSGPYLIPRVTIAHQGVQLSHVSWNQRTLDLAVVDVLGRISVFTIIAINRLAPTRLNISDQEDDLGAVVGMIWLNTESMVNGFFCPLICYLERLTLARCPGIVRPPRLKVYSIIACPSIKQWAPLRQRPNPLLSA